MRETTSFEPSRAKIRRGVCPLGELLKKVYFAYYLTYLSRSFSWIELHEILHEGHLVDVINRAKFYFN